MIAYQKPKTLYYDDTIYWLDNAWFAEMRASLWIPEHERCLVDAEISAILTRTIQEECPFSRYTTRDETTDDKPTFTRLHRRYTYEQPGYERIETWRAPAHLSELRIAPQGAPIVSLDLRRLSYHGDTVRGALHDGVLYVVLE